VVAVLDRARAANTHKQDFVYGQGIDEIVMLEQADVLHHDGDTGELTRHFYHRNALGSVLAITDMLEAKAVTYRYAPYGALTITVGATPHGSDPLAQHWTFTGRFFDEETGLYYYRARAYDPAMGRFLQRDPLGYGPAPSVHEYVRSSPSGRTDPLGLDDEEPGLDEARKDLERAETEHDKAYAEAEKAPLRTRLAERDGASDPGPYPDGNTSDWDAYREAMKALDEARARLRAAREAYWRVFSRSSLQEMRTAPLPPSPHGVPAPGTPLPEPTLPAPYSLEEILEREAEKYRSEQERERLRRRQAELLRSGTRCLAWWYPGGSADPVCIVMMVNGKVVDGPFLEAYRRTTKRPRGLLHSLAMAEGCW
jgi:RHS repeat-associated protein